MRKSILTLFILVLAIFGCGGSGTNITPIPEPGPIEVGNGPGTGISIERSDKVKTGAYYYSWYTGNNWHGVNQITPSLETYTSTNEIVTLSHLSTAKANGIDFFALEINDDFSRDTLENGLLKLWEEAPNPEMEFLFFYDIAIYFKHLGIDFDNLSVDTNPKLVEALTDHTAWFSRFMGLDNHLKINGKPAFIVYVSWRLPTETIEFIRNEFEKNGHSIYFIGDEAYFGRVANGSMSKRLSRGGFDSVTAYNLYDGSGGKYYLRYEEQIDSVTTAFSNKVDYISVCTTNYDDSGVIDRTYAPLYPENEEQVELTLESCYKNVFNLQNNDYGIMIFTTWNEWFEGSSIEPSKEYGSMVLKTIDRYAKARK